MKPGEQIRKVEELLQRPMGCTMMDVIEECKTTTPSRRLSDLRKRDWIITKHKVEGKNYHRFFGNPPPKKSGGMEISKKCLTSDLVYA